MIMKFYPTKKIEIWTDIPSEYHLNSLTLYKK